MIGPSAGVDDAGPDNGVEVTTSCEADPGVMLNAWLDRSHEARALSPSNATFAPAPVVPQPAKPAIPAVTVSGLLLEHAIGAPPVIVSVTGAVELPVMTLAPASSTAAFPAGRRTAVLLCTVRGETTKTSCEAVPMVMLNALLVTGVNAICSRHGVQPFPIAFTECLKVTTPADSVLAQLSDNEMPVTLWRGV